MVERLLDATYHALAHPVRRDILARLRTGDARVTELAAGYEVSLAATSKHLQVLEAAGLVTRTVRGREHLLGLDARPLATATAWTESYREFWERRLDKLEELLRDRAR